MQRKAIESGVLVIAAALVVFAGYYAMNHGSPSAGPSESASGSSAGRSNGSSGGGAPAAIRFVKNPEPAPAFQDRDLSGNTISTADWKGKVVLLNFWATWCPPCREEIPEMIALQKQYKGQLQIIGVSEDEDPPEKVLQFAQRMGMNYPSIMATTKLTDAYGGVPALPTTFVIDKESRVMQRHTGLWAKGDYEREIRALLGLGADAPIETFTDTGEVFLKNVENATELPEVSFDGLNEAQKKDALHRLNAEGCTCGCNLTVAQCRVSDTSCPVSRARANQIVKDVLAGRVSTPPPPAAASKPTAD